MTNTTPVPPVPSREAVDAVLNCDYMSVPVRELQNVAKYLRAEVERLTNDLADALDLRNGCGPTVLTALVEERDELRATVADQAAALAERDKDAERYRCIRADDFDTSKLFLQTDCVQEGHTFGYIDQIFSSERLDAAIDAALAASVSSASEDKP